MSPDQLLAYFDRISEAPDAVPRLRRFILDLAVRGKLVEQYPNDESAAELLKRIQTEKVRLAKEGKGGKDKLSVPLLDDDLPFSIPAGWQWSQLATIGFISPRNDADGALLASFVPMTLIPAEYGSSHSHEVRPWHEIKSGYTHFAEGDVGLAKITPCFENGKSTIFRRLTGGIGAGTTELHIVRPLLINTDYVLLFLKCPHFIETGIPRMTGTAGQKRVSAEYFAYSPFPLPPLAEQHRIVAKVDELMALCDRLEAAQAEREGRRDRLVAASLNRLNNGADAESFCEHARFHFRHLPRLTTRREHIQQLRQAILSLAVRGQLVPQDPNDEPASKLLNRIQAQKARLMKEGKIKPPPLPATPEDKMPFRLPTDWEWVRFGELIIDADAGWSPKSEGFPRSGVNWGVLKVSAVSWNKFLPEENKQLLPGIMPPEAAQVHAGDFLISRANTSELVAKCVVVDKEPRNLILSDKIVRLQIAETCSKKFLCMVNNHAEYARSYYAEEASGTSLSMKNVSRSVIYALAIPLPPFSEQRRIVTKVDELMTLCDQLEAQLTINQTENRHLLDAILHHALALAA